MTAARIVVRGASIVIVLVLAVGGLPAAVAQESSPTRPVGPDGKSAPATPVVPPAVELTVLRPWSVAARAGFVLPTGLEHSPGYGDVGIEVGRWLNSSVGAQARLSRGLAGSRLVRSATSNAVEEAQFTVGTLAELLGRVRLGRGNIYAIGGAGPAVIFAGDYGVVPLIDGEGGIEVRTSTGLTFTAKFQGGIPLRTSAPEIDPSRCITPDCPSRFQAGRLVLGSALAVGYAF
jgi:hypothetical protein